MYYVPQQHVPVAQFAPQGWVGDMVSNQAAIIGGGVGGLTTELTGHATLGGLAGGLTTTLARNYGHMIPFNAAGPVPVAQPAAFAPQGFFGRIGGNLLGGAIGGAFGNRQLGSTIGGAVGNLLPFEAGPAAMAQPVAYAPQGFWGDMISNVGGAVGGVIGGNTGNIIRDASGLATYLPFSAGPVAQPVAYAPQGFWGDMISNVGGAVGGVIGGNTGNIIRDASGLASYLPFNAGPVTQPMAYAPQGFWGDMISNVGGAVGGVVGGNTGNIIRDASGLASYLPFSAGPVAQPAYAPQGIFGRIGGGLLGGAIGGAFGNRQLGSTIGGAVGNLLPFQAGPMTVAQPSYAPQGFWGDMISNVGGAVGGVIGGKTGNIIRDASGLASYLPFNAGPVPMAQPVAYAPQGIFGSIGGGLLGGAIGGALGNRGAGSAIGSAIGAFLPFQAGPGQPIQYVSVADLQAAQMPNTQAMDSQIVYH